MNLTDFIPGGAIIDAVKTVIDRVVPDKNAAAAAKAALETQAFTQEFQIQIAQIEVNKSEASGNWFTSGWRPACGWIGAFSLGYAAILEPFARFISVVVFDYHGGFPVLDSTITMQVLFGILGLGAYRSIDKRNGVAQ